MAQGHEAIRARTAQRFKEPNLHALLLKRVVMGNVVIDHEDVVRTFPEGPGSVELVCVYVVEQGKIQSATFSIGPQVPRPATTDAVGQKKLGQAPFSTPPPGSFGSQFGLSIALT